MDGLFRDALTHNPGDRLFAVFIDLNLPPEPPRPAGPTCANEAEQLLHPYRAENIPPAPCALVAFTNFAWHYLGTAEVRSSTLARLFVPARSDHEIQQGETVTALLDV